jgi:hypothetical protein
MVRPVGDVVCCFRGAEEKQTPGQKKRPRNGRCAAAARLSAARLYDTPE